jgi:NAD(P)-dependent dehydrogenase (short-subunit alcohol dehydrogenase family)
MEMTGRIAIVTGANSGIGKVTARELAKEGATVIMTARDEARGKAALEDVKRAAGSDSVELMLCDFSSQRSIRAFARAFRGKYDALHVLVNNAGALVPERKVTEDGLELTFAANHLGYFLTTELLLDRLKASAPSRIVCVASAGHTRARGIPWDDLNFERGYSGIEAYCVSKLANVLFTFELARKLEGTGVTANCLHPGAVATNFGLGGGWFKWAVKLAQPFMIDDEKGAETQIFLASSPEVEGVTGKYYVKKRPIAPSRAAQDPAAAARLWKLSEELVAKSGEFANSA